MQNEINKEGMIKDIDTHVSEISNEFKKGLQFISNFPKSVTFFGSSRLTNKSSHYNDAEKLAERIVKETEYTVITGGGPGIMEAANMGAKNAGGKSIGMNILLPKEQKINPYVTDSIDFNYFLARKSLMMFSAECYIFFPGGFGTFDELFGVLTLIQTKKIQRVPVILFGKDFWTPIKNIIEDRMLNSHHTIEAEDMNLFQLTDSMDSVIKVIKEAPVSEWWSYFD